ncbi:AAA family ATPase [Pseudomonas viridiflava]|uniref:AAA family ATPase n=1 Tax=Pseudomonas viridiflava TaxID=33069 RepID=UPI000F02E7BE
MIIESPTIEDLHRSINPTVNFNKDITLLVGINGCGKTSILNVIDWRSKKQPHQLCKALAFVQ